MKVTHGGDWFIQVFLSLLFTLIVNSVLSRIIQRVLFKLKKTHTIWDKAIVNALQRPLKVFIWIIGISFAGIIISRTPEYNILFHSISSIRDLGIVVTVIWFFLRVTRNIETSVIERQKTAEDRLDTATIGSICQLFKVAIFITGILIALQTTGVSVSAVLTFGGAGGLVIGFAAKDLLANFFGALMLFLDRPFTVGEKIRSPDRDIEGVVEHIGWRLTRIRTFDKRPLFVPNGIFSMISIQNPSRMTNRRIKTTIGIRYDDATKADQILLDIERMLAEHPEIDQNLVTCVKIIEFAPSSLNFQVYTFTKTTDWVKFQGIQHEVFLKIITIIDSHGAECAYPTTTLHVPEGIAIKS